MLFLKQSTASQSVLLGPFVDDTDGATAETALTIANTDIRLSKNGGNMAAKNSGGGTHDEAGWYQITLDATDTDTVGRLQVSCKVAGALPVFMEFQVLEEAIFDAMFASSATGFDASGNVSLADGHITAAKLGSNAITAAKIATDAITAAKIAADAIGSSELASTAINAIADQVWDEARADHTGAGSFGEGVASVQGNVTGSIGSLATQAKADVNAEADTALSDIGLDHLVSASVAGTDVADNSIVAQLASKAATADWDTYDNTTDALEAISDSGGGGPTAGQIADAVWDEARADHTSAGSFGQGVASVQGSVTGNVDGNVGGNVTGSVGSVSGVSFPTNFGDLSITASTGLVNITQTAADKAWSTTTRTLTAGTKDSEIDAIKAKTDSLAFTVANVVDANIQYVNDVQVGGTGAEGNEWGPA